MDLGRSSTSITRYTIVDIVRGLSALAILVWHYQHFYFTSPGQNTTFSTYYIEPFYNVLWPLYIHGAVAVKIFWTISGFVFCHAYCKNENVSAREFFIHRFSRLYPLHFLTLILVLVLQLLSRQIIGQDQIYINTDLRHFILQLFFASNWNADSGLSFNGPIWSVSVEVIIYTLFLALIRLNRTGLYSAFAISVASSVALKWLPEGWANDNILRCAAFFFAGVFVCRLNAALSRRSAPLNLALAITAVPVLWIYWMVLGGSPKLAELALFSIVVWLAAAAEHLGLEKVLRSARWVGDITYSTYLLHVPAQILILIILDAVVGARAVVGNRLFFVGFFVAIVGLSILSYRYIERPAQKWLRTRMSPSLRAEEKPT